MIKHILSLKLAALLGMASLGTTVSFGETGGTTADIIGSFTSSTQTLSVAPSAAQSFIAFQMDITVPTSVTAVSVTSGQALNVEGKAIMNFASNVIEGTNKNTIRVIAYNLNNDTYTVSAGAELFNAALTTSSAITYSDLVFSNVLYVTESDVATDQSWSGTIEEGSAAGSGDVNGDGKVTISDHSAILDIILENTTYTNNPSAYDLTAADVNGDGKVTIADGSELLLILLQ